MKQFLDSRTFNLVCENYRNGMIDHPTFLRFLADQYESAEKVMMQQEKIYVNRDVEESELWCAAHHRTIAVQFMFDDAYRCQM